MLTEKIENEYEKWLEYAEEGLKRELAQMRDNESEIEDAFYRNLTFGTGGLRGIIGAGTNRVNVHTVAKASQGIANYLHKHFPEDRRSVAISYDSRIKSDIFAEVAAGVFAANNIKVYQYSELMPTPCLSYAVRALGCAAGIMITASHNPSSYNGYKVYNQDGCQITIEMADAIFAEIEKLNIFSDIRKIDFSEGLENGKISFIPKNIYDRFIEEVKKQSVLYGEKIDKNIAIVYSPLNGTGLKPVTRVLTESGYSNITVVREQQEPDGLFTTCPYPNPEKKETLELGIKYAKNLDADLVLATDPDCDRVGIAVKKDNGEYVLLSGNEVGLLLLDYLCAQRTKHDQMPADPVMIKTIVTIDLAEKIAAHYGARTINVLTGFKYIGEQIGYLEQQKKENSYLFGFEESYGYLSGTYVRDKDGVNAAYLICEMFAYYKTRNISLSEKLEEIYKVYGYCLNTLYSYEFTGPTGMKKMKDIMSRIRDEKQSIGGPKVVECIDYLQGIDELPKSDVLKFVLECGSVVIRPSGTEPKLKAYISISGTNRENVMRIERNVSEEISELLQN